MPGHLHTGAAVSLQRRCDQRGPAAGEGIEDPPAGLADPNQLAHQRGGLAGEWNEKDFDYGNRQGVSIGKIFGFRKPQLFSTYAQSKQEFGLLCIDTGLPARAA